MTTPPPILFQVIGADLIGFIVGVAQLLEAFPEFRLTSWFRSYGHNAAEGGSDSSQHLLGLAVDLAGDGLRNEGLVSQLRQRAARLGFAVVDERASARPHLHLQRYPANAKPEVVRVLTFFARFLFP